MFAIVRYQPHEIVYRGCAPAGVHHTVEDIAEAQGRAHDLKNIHYMVQRRPLAVPYYPDRYYFWPIHQYPANLYFRAARALKRQRQNNHLYLYSYHIHVTFVLQRSQLRTCLPGKRGCRPFRRLFGEAVRRDPGCFWNSATFREPETSTPMRTRNESSAK